MNFETPNDELYQKAVDAIIELFNDQSVSQDRTVRNLEELLEEIRVLMDTLADKGLDNEEV